MKTILYIISLMVWLCTTGQAQTQSTFPYPQIPNTLNTTEQRAGYLASHYWDNFDFTDSIQLHDTDIVEQGFVNYIDLLARFSTAASLNSVSLFCSKAFQYPQSKAKFESLIDHYLDNIGSPLRNDRIYLLFLRGMKDSPSFSNAEKERLGFKIKEIDKNLPGNIATDFIFTDKAGKAHHLRDYKEQKVILYFYDPDCENCHRVSAWLHQQDIPSDIAFLSIHADDAITDLYSLRAMPTLYLLDKGNTVLLKDCTPEWLMENIK